jgi:hypothetical protein
MGYKFGLLLLARRPHLLPHISAKPRVEVLVDVIVSCLPVCIPLGSLLTTIGTHDGQPRLLWPPQAAVGTFPPVVGRTSTFAVPSRRSARP